MISPATKAALMAQDVELIKRDLSEIKDSLRHQMEQAMTINLIKLNVAELKENQTQFVREKDFKIVRSIVYTAAGTVLVAFLTAVITLVRIKFA